MAQLPQIRPAGVGVKRDHDGLTLEPAPLVGLAHAVAARYRLRRFLCETPIGQSSSLDRLVGAQIGFKMESFQRSGSFKARTAFNTLLCALERDEIGDAGVVADSSGNFGQAVALAGRELGVPVTVIAPEDSRTGKLAASRSYGAALVSAGVDWSSRYAMTEQYAAQTGALRVLSASEDGIAGAATIMLEIADQADDFDAIVVPVGTGSLIAGIAVVANALFANVRVIGVQPAASGHARESLAMGEIQKLAEPPNTVADGARTLTLGESAWPIIRDGVEEIVLVSEDEILLAARLLMERTKAVVEPTGALAFASLLGGHVSARRPICIISGGNIDVAELLATY